MQLHCTIEWPYNPIVSDSCKFRWGIIECWTLRHSHQSACKVGTVWGWDLFTQLGVGCVYTVISVCIRVHVHVHTLYTNLVFIAYCLPVHATYMCMYMCMHTFSGIWTSSQSPLSHRCCLKRVRLTSATLWPLQGNALTLWHACSYMYTYYTFMLFSKLLGW